ncbi:hypothetical protein SAMN05428939_0325 [Streptomyces sp. TLI_105]|nr:hypothetical protein SAMN05428939_0325 [Streptomyces sp. TLI_105]
MPVWARSTARHTFGKTSTPACPGARWHPVRGVRRDAPPGRAGDLAGRSDVVGRAPPRPWCVARHAELRPHRRGPAAAGPGGAAAAHCHRRKLVLTVDATNRLGSGAPCSPDRLFCQVCRRGGRSSDQFAPGRPYSFVTALEAGRTSWCGLLDAARIGPDTASPRSPAGGRGSCGQSPGALMVDPLPGLVGGDRLRDPCVELRKGLRSENSSGGSTIRGLDRVDIYTEADRVRVDAAAVVTAVRSDPCRSQNDGSAVMPREEPQVRDAAHVRPEAFVDVGGGQGPRTVPGQSSISCGHDRQHGRSAALLRSGCRRRPPRRPHGGRTGSAPSARSPRGSPGWPGHRRGRPSGCRPRPGRPRAARRGACSLHGARILSSGRRRPRGEYETAGREACTRPSAPEG